VEGFSPLIIFVDEYLAMQSPLKAEKLVDDLENSALSRFKEHYKLIIASFKQGRNCLMSMKVGAAEEKNYPDVYVSKKATWEVNRIKKQEDFQEIYNRNPVKSARTFEFKEIDGVDENVFFRLLDRLRDTFVTPDNNPFVGDVITCRTDQLKILEFKQWFRPDTSITYYIHLDLAKGTAKDRAGFCMCRKEGLESLTSEDLHRYINGEHVNKEFRVKTVMILQLIASKEGQIIFDEIRQFIMKLVDWGFKIEVTLDGYNSLDFIQILTAKGVKSELLSVDRDKKAYDSLQSLIYRRNIDIYEHPILFRELEELEESADGKKVDHPQYSLRRQRTEDNINAGSKDIADALAGAALRAMLAPSANIPLMPQMQQSFHPKQEQYDEEDNFEQSVMGGLVSMDKLSKYEHGRDRSKSSTMFVPLFPTRG
jgi:hypothetical protein